MTEFEMTGCHYRLNGHEFEHAPGIGDGQGSLACCSPWGRRVGHFLKFLFGLMWTILKVFIEFATISFLF